MAHPLHYGCIPVDSGIARSQDFDHHVRARCHWSPSMGPPRGGHIDTVGNIELRLARTNGDGIWNPWCGLTGGYTQVGRPPTRFWTERFLQYRDKPPQSFKAAGQS
jgi:hypothetical protein